MREIQYSVDVRRGARFGGLGVGVDEGGNELFTNAYTMLELLGWGMATLRQLRVPTVLMVMEKR